MANELRTRTLSALILGGAVIALTLWRFESFAALCLVGGGVLAREWWHLTKHRHRGWLLVGALYLGTAVVALIFLRYADVRLIIYLFAIVWCGDIAAYLIGRKFGKHKIAPAISPGKSWQGLAASLVASALLSMYLEPISDWRMNALMGAALAIIGLGGDLFESALKRHAGVKDSGRFIPGHGGLFDRVDALLPCAIAVAGLCVWHIITVS
jgi:phosphatidate cytidylyltransferase